MTAAERDARNASYWTVFQQDAVRTGMFRHQSIPVS
jgi:hypothetical protein